MKLEDQVVSLELAKKLKELEVKQESYFYWQFCEGYKEEWQLRTLPIPRSRPIFADDFMAPEEVYSAFTVAELGISLPEEYESWREDDNEWGKWLCNGPKGNLRLADSEANARAKMLVYLLEHELLN